MSRSPGPDNNTDFAGEPRLRELETEVQRLRKTNEVLLDRVENRINVEAGAFAAFQVASSLEKTVADRTTELRRLNARLERELDLRRKFETALLKAKSQAEEATASRTRFVAAASHDLRQPLNAAVLYLEAIDRESLSETDADSLRQIGLALANLDGLLGALLDISRLDSGGLQPEPSDFPLQPLFHKLASEYGAIANVKGLQLIVRPSAYAVHSDPVLLETILRNLLGNAIKYTDSGRVLMVARRRGDRVRIEVRDSGMGIAGEHQLHIFEEFWRAPGSSRSERGSAGLGLSIVQRICQLLGTEIGVMSEPGRGSIFALELPHRELSAHKPPVDRAPPAAVIGFQRCLVVVVDDNTAVLLSMARMLQGWDCEVVTANGVEEALTTLIDGDLQPALLLTDYHLAGDSNGIEAIEAINAELARPAPAVMISSDNSTTLAQELALRDIPLLTKPVEPARLRAVMHHLLATVQPA